MQSANEQLAFYQLITRCLNDTASAAERYKLTQCLDEPEARALFERIRGGWERSPRNLKNGCDVDDILDKVAEAVAAESHTQEASAPDEARPDRTRIFQFPNWLKSPAFGAIAASLAIIAASSMFWIKQNSSKTAATQPVTWVQQNCDTKERLQITLGDGTKITLNSKSSISYPEKFGTRGRVVRLTGEAYFDVTRDESRPFVIETPTLRVKVLGTQFNVRAYSDGSEAKVTLVKGKVEVTEVAAENQTASKPVFLTPGQQFNVAPETKKAEVQPVSAEVAMGWMQDRFIWDYESAAFAMHQLERRFGISIEFTDKKLGAWRLSGRFDGESLEEIFDALCATKIFDCQIVQNKDNNKIERVILSPGKLARLPAK